MEYILQNKNLKVSLSTLGASIVSVEIIDAFGAVEVALSPKMRENFVQGSYAGAVIGPAAGRIANGCFMLGKEKIILTQNDGTQNLHGGINSLSAQVWHASRLSGTQVTMSVTMPDKVDGFPGNRTFTVEYTLLEKTLRMMLTAVTDKATFVDCTSHAYWNLSGDFSKSIEDHLLKIPADKVYFNDENHVPVSAASVLKTPFDFQKEVLLAKYLHMQHPQLQNARGYNNCFILKNKNEKGDLLQKAATLTHPATHRSLQVYTDAPAIVLYTGGYLDSSLLLRGNISAVPSCALALECGGVPNSVNMGRPSFLQPNEKWKRIIEYRFDTVSDAEKKKAENTKTKQEQVASALSLLQNSVFVNLLEWMTKSEAKKELAAHHIPLDLDAPFLLMAVRIDEFSEGLKPHEEFLILMEMAGVVRQNLSRKFTCYHCSFHHTDMMWILQPNKDDGEELLAFCKHRLEAVQTQAKKYNITPSIVYDELITYENVHKRYQKLLSILNQIFTQGEGGVLANSKFYLDRHIATPPAEKVELYKSIEDLKLSLDSDTGKPFETLLNDLLFRQNGTDLAHKLEIYHAVCGAMLEYIETAGLTEVVFADPENFELFYTYRGRKHFSRNLTKLAVLLKENHGKHLKKRNDTACCCCAEVCLKKVTRISRPL